MYFSEYFSGICNEELQHPPIPSSPHILGPIPQITTAEVKLAVEKMKSSMETGPDDTPAEDWKILGDRGASFLANFFDRIVAKNKPPHVWTTCTTVWKGKGDVSECANYQSI